MAALIKLSPNSDIYKPLRMVIYGSGSDGKTTACLSLLKNPNLKVILIAAEATTLPAADLAMEVWGIDELKEGQLTIVEPTKEAFATLDPKSEIGYLAVHKPLLGTFPAVDAATGKPVQLKKLTEYGRDTVIIYDGFSAVNEKIQFKGLKDFEAQGGGKDRRNMYQCGQQLVYLYFAILNSASCHLILTAHTGSPTEEDALKKYEGVKKYNPDFYTKSLVNKVTKDFGWVLLACKEQVGGKAIRYLSGIDKEYFTKTMFNEKKFEEDCIGLNVDTVTKKPKTNVLEHIKLGQLPCDLTHPIYPFLKGEQ